MEQGKASATALLVATQRAAHQLFDQPIVFRDPLAVPILGNGAEAKLRGDEASYRSDFSLRFRSAVVARSRYADDMLTAALARGVRQIVILGAGLDTRAYRGDLPAGTRVFEVDDPATQLWKKAMLAAAGIAVPGLVTFIPVDFDKVPLGDALRAGGVDAGQPAFLSWLGVVYYLPAETVLSTLATVGGLAPGSEIVFDYFEPAQNYTAAEAPGFSGLQTQVASVGEPWKCFFAPAEMEADLRRAGFGTVTDSDSAAMAARYFAGRSDGLAPGGPVHFVDALVGARG